MDSDKRKLRDEAIRLFDTDSMQVNQEVLKMISEYLFKVIFIHGSDEVTTRRIAEAKIVLQMIFSKTVHLGNMLNGFSYVSRDGHVLNQINDPTVMAVLVRNIFETIAMFNIIYIAPKNDDEKTIMYNLWVLSGLKYRQRFGKHIKSAENKAKQLDEAAQIDKHIEIITQTALYNSFDDKSKEIIKTCIKRKDYKIQITSKDVKILSWAEIIPVMGMREELMGEMYTYFSLYSHPSNVSVFQFGTLFSEKNRDFISMGNFNVANGIKLICYFIADFIKLFPETLNTFNAQPLMSQIVINWNNRFIRANKGDINNALSSLD